MLPNTRHLLRELTAWFLPAGIFLLLSASLFAQSDDLAGESRRAKELMAAGKFEEAVPIYRDLVRARPNDPGLIMNLGLALHMAGRDQEATEQLEAALKLDSNLLPANLFLGASYLRLGKPAKAVRPLERVIQTQPEHREAREILADALFSLERFEAAANHYRRLADLDPQSPKAWYNLGRAYEALAGRAFEELEKVAPESAYWFALVAESRVRQRQFGSAFYFYRKALEKMPAMRGLHAGLAEVYRLSGHPDWAALEEENERNMGSPDCSAQGLECDFLAGRYREIAASPMHAKTAEAHYWRARAYNELVLQAFARLGQLPPSAQMHELMAQIHRNQRRHRESVEEWRKALELVPGDPRLQKELGVSLLMISDYDAAKGIFETLLQQEPDSAELNFLLGDTLLQQQKVAESIPFLKKSVERGPTLLSAHRSLAYAYLQIRQGEQAIPHLKAALPIDEDGSLHYQLARAYQSSGQPELAREMLKKYQEINRLAMEVRQTLKQEFEITPP